MEMSAIVEVDELVAAAPEVVAVQVGRRQRPTSLISSSS